MGKAHCSHRFPPGATRDRFEPRGRYEEPHPADCPSGADGGGLLLDSPDLAVSLHTRSQTTKKPLPQRDCPGPQQPAGFSPDTRRDRGFCIV